MDHQLAIDISAMRTGFRSAFGARKVRESFRRRGRIVNRKRIARVMSEQGWYGIPRRRIRQGAAVRVHSRFANVLKRQFVAAKPNEVWMGDMTEFPTGEGKVYMADILDAFSGQLVGYSFGTAPTSELAGAALERARRWRRPGRGLVHHTDQGPAYVAWGYQSQLEVLGAVPSWSARGTPADNARVESFHALFKREFLRGRVFATRSEAISEATRWLRFYQRHRYHSSLGNLTPAEFERHNGPN